MHAPARPAPLPAGDYAAGTAPQLQGPASNRTAQYLAGIDPAHPGQQAFYRAALHDVPHPLLAGQQISYGQLQDLVRGPQGAQVLQAFGQQRRLDRTPTADQVQALLFDEAHARLLARGAQNPGQLAFGPAADVALRAPVTARNLGHGNYVNLPSGQLSNPVAAAQRFADLPVADGTAYAAPAMGLPALTNPLAPR